MSLEIVFYAIPFSAQNARTWITIDPVIIKRSHIDNGHKPVAGNIFYFGSSKQESIIGFVLNDVAASSIVQHGFDKRETLGIMHCATLKDAKTKIHFFLTGAAIPHFRPYDEPNLLKPVAYAPASAEVTIEPARKPIRGITADWRKTFKPPAPLAERAEPTRFIWNLVPTKGKRAMVSGARAARIEREKTAAYEAALKAEYG